LAAYRRWSFGERTNIQNDGKAEQDCSHCGASMQMNSTGKDNEPH
jgi:hypothetical protein